MALSTSTNGSIGSQSNTQNPQTAIQPVSAATKSGSVQPGTANSLLTSQQGGVPLQTTVLSTVSLNPSALQTAVPTTGTASSPPKQHHVSYVLLGFPVVLILVAVILFWTIRRSVKSTTE